jgi:polyphosphate kinase
MAKKKRKKGDEPDLDAPELYINRELSWLEFNHRVLEEGLSDALPLMERLKFLSIVSSNLDEFFMIRVAGLVQQRQAGLRKRDIAGLTPAQQLRRIYQRVHRMVREQSEGIAAVLAALRDEGLSVLEPQEWDPEQRRFLLTYFQTEVEPVLTPLAVEELSPPPLLPGLGLNVALRMRSGDDDEASEEIAVVPVPGQFPRFITVPAETEGVYLARLEDVIAAGASRWFEQCEIEASAVFRVTRDADVAVHDDEVADLLQAMEEAVLARRRRRAVRLEVSARPDKPIRNWLVEWLELRTEEVYEIDGMLDATDLMEIAGRPGFDSLKIQEWPPEPPRDLVEADDLWLAVQERDCLLFHPYESFEPVVQLMEAAAEDPSVLAIKQVLYRTSADSPVIGALERAAKNGKQVTVLVELKARFDEERNVDWARRLEDAGCHVIYGIAGYKTHSKALLIVRREANRIRRYVHLATGNYNERTAKLYSDIGLMTSDNDYATDVASFFNLLTGYSDAVGFSRLVMAPTGLRRRFMELIEREIRASTPDRPGLIVAKVNSLHDKGIAKALYRASRAGVEVRLNVRGICCVRPGLEGISENLQVRSIVDRFLEHARIFYFRNGGHEEVYLASADWMSRNLDKRLELLFPVVDPDLMRRLIGFLDTYFADNVKARRLLADGTWDRVPTEGEPLRAQQRFYREAMEAALARREARVRFRPLTAPEQ